MNFHHIDSDGWITLATKENGNFKQYHYRIDELQQKLSEWTGQNIYFSQNTFYRPQRRIENIRQLRSLYVDIDCYTKELSPQQVLMYLDSEYFNQTIPEPNYIIFSGRGIVLVWLIEPVPFKALPLWQAVENFLFKQLESFGADSKATDAARVFRIAGTVNSKNSKNVKVEYRNEYRYALRDIQDTYLPELKPKKERQSKEGRQDKNKVANLFNTYTLHFNRIRDLVKLIELRNYDVEGHRENILFLYRYWSCCYLKDSAEALRQTLELNAEFVKPLSKREAEKATQSAEKAWNAKNDEVANYTAITKGFRRGAGYNFTNAKLISMLDISLDEQKHMKTIISNEEKQRRKTVKRREQGVKPRDEYISEQQKVTQDRIEAIKRLMNENPGIKTKQLAEMLSITPRRVRQLKEYI